MLLAKKIVSRVLILAAVLVLVGCDHASKGIAKAELETTGAHELIQGVVGLRYVENRDIAFNLLRQVPESIRIPALLISGAAIIVVLCRLLLDARQRVRVPMFALILVTAGAIGNYLDRVFRGYVIDFIHVRHWPVFNVADAYITVGFVLFAWAYMLNRRRSVPADG